MENPQPNAMIKISTIFSKIKANCPHCKNQHWIITDILIKPYYYISLTIGYELDFVLHCSHCGLTIFQHIGFFDENLNTLEPIHNEEIFLIFVNLRLEPKLYAKIQQLKQSE